MLASLSIRDIVLIDRLDLEFGDGMTVLTGETGAGKSILLDSLSLALGGRGDGGLVRAGQKQGQIVASFDLTPSHPVFSLLEEQGLSSGSDLILRRVQNGDGRTRAYVNDQPVSAGMLRQIGDGLVEIHGQHDDRALVDVSVHRSLLDAFGGLQGQVAKVGKLFKDWRKAEKDLAHLEHSIEEARKEADYLNASVDELSAFGPVEGEEDELAAKRTVMMQSEKIAGDLNEAFEVLDGNASPIPTLSGMMRRLERKTEQMPGLLDETLQHLNVALNALEEARGSLEEAQRQTDFDPRELEQTEERLFGLRALARKHKLTGDALVGLLAKMREELDTLDHGEERLVALRQAAVSTKALYDKAAVDLSKKRKKVADALIKEVMAELPSLKLEAARFLVNMTSDGEARSEDGIDQLEFWVQTNPGTKAGPMMKVASGGELSRFLLALKVAMADKGSAPTLVFDEIDTGVGGAVADAIGRRLARLAGNVQVLSVTHAPQVASRADAHMRIAKTAVKGENRVATGVSVIDGDHREEEIARMLAGDVVSDEARAAARRLMSDEKARA
ncbi:DNA repair protein RecN [Cohaesibacter celericrescens]|uniref:DNA repair protein RecN n=1 Tax=Cohaesibacter celericrescens TaxID=2067669 RepID=A0A2N5XM86_9HYPH|nr:DNA repair protein RecN [Cohaesibacter celericrescens]PLW75537.1 DNA repair protein RecN [Cohaesibacter celericrescens]PLW78944.1 DNA repair protein RecN [Cohaesibacter celericrescens]